MSDAKEQESVDLFDAYFDWDPSVDDSVFELYRYYGENTVNRVLQKDFICFRLSAAENFEDKMEGKAIEVYYDLALDRLKRAGKITQEEYDVLAYLDISQNEFFFSKHPVGIQQYTDTKFEEYIICFSSESDDPYMFQNYGEYCLTLTRGNLLSPLLGRENLRAVLTPVLYGDDIVKYLESKIKEVIDSPDMKRDMTWFIGEVLHCLQFVAKQSKYSKENERRLIVYLPEGETKLIPEIERTESDGKRYIYLKYSKDLLCGINVWSNYEIASKDTLNKLNRFGYSIE